jgi:hypothetical protein
MIDVEFRGECARLLFEVLDRPRSTRSKLQFQKGRKDGSKLLLQLAGANASNSGMKNGDLALLRYCLRASQDTDSPLVFWRQITPFLPSDATLDDETQLIKSAERLSRTFATFTGRNESFTFSIAASALTAHLGRRPVQIDLCLSPSLFELIRGAST